MKDKFVVEIEGKEIHVIDPSDIVNVKFYEGTEREQPYVRATCRTLELSPWGPIPVRVMVEGSCAKEIFDKLSSLLPKKRLVVKVPNKEQK